MLPFLNMLSVLFLLNAMISSNPLLSDILISNWNIHGVSFLFLHLNININKTCNLLLLYVFVLFGLWCKSNNYVNKNWRKKNICETSKPHRDNAPKQENHKTKQDNRMYETHLNKKDETLKHQTRKS